MDKTQLPVYNFIANNNTPVNHSQVTAPGTIYFDAATGNLLSAPPVRGDLRPNGVKYHVGEKFGNIISYHGASFFGKY